MKNIKRLLSILLVACLCLCAAGCNKTTDTNSSGLVSTITETETIYIEESLSSDTTTQENAVSSTASTTSNESATQSAITSSTATQSTVTNPTVTPSSSETATTSIPSSENQDWPEWTREYPANQVVDWCSLYETGTFALVITKQNELYLFLYGKLFSNGTHFKKVETEFKVEKFLPRGGSVNPKVITTDNKILSCLPFENDNMNTVNYNCPIIDITEEYKEELCKKTVGEYNKNFYHYYYDENKYLHYEKNNILSFENEVLYSFPQGENILLANNNIVQTTKGFYIFKASYEKEFADSEPQLVAKANFVSETLDGIFIKLHKVYRGNWPYDY